ncbi:hypothetical protein C8R45DRAFT_933116 [Mycena sanguinolenta]|nr:hypothetical protein C8R45DRAFT_933116 [Mycena sanguinolenta]
MSQSRATRSDAGVKRRASERDDEDETDADAQQDNGDSTNGPIVEEPDDPTPAPSAPPTKRRKTPKPAHKGRSGGADKENENGIGRRDDEVTCAAAERLRRRTKSRAIIQDEEDGDDAPSSVDNFSSPSITPNASPSNAVHVPALDATTPDPFLQYIDPRLLVPQ